MSQKPKIYNNNNIIVVITLSLPWSTFTVGLDNLLDAMERNGFQ
jgi:hypothetical protein